MKKRCEECKKKIKSIMVFACKCEKYYCNLHKVEHDCPFDYRKEQTEKLKKENPKVVNSKVLKI